MRVVLSQTRLEEALPLLAKAMCSCSTLRVLNIHFAQADVVMDVKQAFQRYAFPSVDTLIMPSQTHWVMRSCPNVKRVFCHHGDGSQIVSAMQVCKRVEVLEGIHFSLSAVESEFVHFRDIFHLRMHVHRVEPVIGLVKAGPRLRRLRFGQAREPPTVGLMELLGGLKHLRYLELRVPWIVFQNTPTPIPWQYWSPAMPPRSPQDVETQLKDHLAALRRLLKDCKVVIKPRLSSDDPPSRDNWTFTIHIKA